MNLSGKMVTILMGGGIWKIQANKKLHVENFWTSGKGNSRYLDSSLISLFVTYLKIEFVRGAAPRYTYFF